MESTEADSGDPPLNSEEAAESSVVPNETDNPDQPEESNGSTEPEGPEDRMVDPNKVYYLILDADDPEVKMNVYSLDRSEIPGDSATETAKESSEFVNGSEEGFSGFFTNLFNSVRTSFKTNTTNIIHSINETFMGRTNPNVMNEFAAGRTNTNTMNEFVSGRPGVVGFENEVRTGRSGTNIFENDVRTGRSGSNVFENDVRSGRPSTNVFENDVRSGPSEINFFENESGVSRPGGVGDHEFTNRPGVNPEETLNRVRVDQPNLEPISEPVSGPNRPVVTTGERTANIFNALAERLTNLTGGNKPNVVLPELEGKSYRIPLEETIPAMRSLDREWNIPEVVDPRSKYPPEIVEIFDKLTPGINGTDGIPAGIPDDVSTALKSLGKKDYWANVGLYNQLTMEILDFRDGRQKYAKFQHRSNVLDKVVASAKSYNGEAKFKTKHGTTTTIPPFNGDRLWAFHFRGEFRPIPPFDLEVISPGLSRFLNPPELPEALHEYLIDGDMRKGLNHDLINSQIEENIRNQIPSKLDEIYSNHLNYLQQYDLYRKIAIDANNEITQIKEKFINTYGQYMNLSPDLQLKLYEKVRGDPNSGLIAPTLRIEVTPDVTESSNSGPGSHYLDRLVITSRTDSDPYAPMQVNE